MSNEEFKELWTNSRGKCFLMCPREHSYRYVRGYSPLSNKSALVFGDLAHKGLEAWWNEPNKSTRLESSVSAMRAAIPAGFDPYLVVDLECMLLGYDSRWRDEDYTTLAVEREFRIPLIDPANGDLSERFERGGKIDVVAFDNRTRRVLTIEHKTTSLDISPGSDYWTLLRVDGQPSGYFHGARAMGFAAEACVYDVLKKPQIEPKKATPVALRKYTKAKAGELPRLYANQRETDETVDEYRARLIADMAEKPEAYFGRMEIVRLEAEMAEYDAEQWDVAHLAAHMTDVGFAPRNTGACKRYGSMCDFMPVCCGEATLEDERLFRHSDTKHPELSQETQR
jgi:hypothetical protein